MKIHNLNLEELLDDQKQTKLLDVFRKILWPMSSPDLHFIELYSALAAGGRRPARPQDGEGYILTVGHKIDTSFLKDFVFTGSSLPLGVTPNFPKYSVN